MPPLACWSRFALIDAALLQADGLADAVAEVVELRPAGDARPLHHDLGDPRRVEGELPLHPLALHDAADGEHLAGAGAAAGDHDAAEDLDPLLLAFEDAAVDVDRVADLEHGTSPPETGFFDQVQ